MEMINGHALVISLMATALISSRVSRLLAPPLYDVLAQRYLRPATAATAPEVPGTDALPAHKPGPVEPG